MADLDPPAKSDTTPPSSDLTEALVRSSVDGILTFDRDLRFTLWNPAMERITGFARADVVGRRAIEIFPFIEESGVAELFRRALAGTESASDTRVYVRPDGTRVHFEGHCSPLRDRSGSIIGGIGIVRDVTDRRLAEEALRERDLQFRSVVENASDAIAILDDHAIATYVSPSLEKMLGYEPSELIGHSPIDFVHPDDLAHASETMARVLTEVGTTFPLEARWRHHDGSWRALDGSSRAFVDRDGELSIIITARDVTEAKRAQEELLRRTAELDAVFQALHDRCLRLDADGRIVTLLAGREEEMIVRPEKAIGKLPRDLLATNVADTVDAAFHQMQKTRQPVTVEWEAAGADGTEYFEARFVPFLENESISVIRNITPRRRAEEALRTSEERLRASQKMEAIGRLAGGVAHDFNNLLTVILGCANLMARSFATPNTYLDEITRAAERAVALTAQLLALSRKQVMQPKVLDLNAIVIDMQTMLRRLIGEHIDLRTSLDFVGKVRADPGQLEQVLLNLVLNARDALTGGGRIVVKTYEADIDEATARGRDGAEPGPHVVLAVEDDGAGMTPDVMAHLFEPFFTTKARGKGTGLGLATVYGIVQQSGGHIAVKSQVGVGSTFAIHFPRVEAQLDTAPPAPPLAFARGTETVLLVEDEDALRKLVADILGECGYKVLEARSAEDALRICDDQSPSAIDLVLTDVVMPGMSGRDLAARIVARWSRANVLLMSGYDDPGPSDGENLALLAKPFTAVTLAQRVRDVLDKSTPSADAGATESVALRK